MVLIVTEPDDPNTDDVIDYFLYHRKPFVRIEEGLENVYLTNCNKKIYANGRMYPFDAFTGYWYRRGNLLPKYESLERFEIYELFMTFKFIENKIQNSVKNCLGGFFSDVFINKLQVSNEVKQSGVNIPNYAIVSQKKELTDFLSICDKCITKTIYQGLVKTRQGSKSVPTSFITKKDLYKIPDTFKPSLVQQFLTREVEIRSFYLDGIFYSGAIFNNEQSKAKADSRVSQVRHKYQPFELDKQLKMQLHKSFKQLNIKTGSIDLVMDKQGDTYFLEINPIGQFGPVSKQCGYHYEEDIYKYLTRT